MNKAIKIFSFLVLFLIGLGSLFKMMHWPGGTFLLTFGLLFVIIGFLPSYGIYSFKKSTTTLEKISIVIGILSLITLFQGYLFRMNHWPGGSLTQVTGMVSFCFIALPIFIFSRYKSTNKVSELIKLVFIGLIITIFLFLQNKSYSYNVLNSFSIISQQQQYSTANMDYLLESQNRFLETAPSNPDLENIEYKISEITSFIENLQIRLISAAEGDAMVIEKIQNPNLIRAKDNTDIPNYVMFGAIIGESDDNATILKNMITALKSDIIQFVESSNLSDNTNFKVLIEDMLSTESVSESSGLTSWEEYMFNGTPLIGTICILNSIENDIKSAELILKTEFLHSVNMR